MELRSRKQPKKNPSEPSIISIKSDGNCLFRCLATFLSEDLYKCKRLLSGIPNNRSLQSQELAYSRTLRFLVTNFIERNKEDYCKSMDYDNEYYDSIEHRLLQMKESGEFVGMLEIKVASLLLKIDINIYVYNNNDLNLVCSFGDFKSKPCNLLLDEEHYEVIKDMKVLVTKKLDLEKSTTEYFSPTEQPKNTTKYYYPNFNKNEVKCIPFICKTIDVQNGILVQLVDEEFNSELKNLAIVGGKEFGTKLDIGWFFWDNFDKLSSWAKQNNILWLL